MRVPHTTIRRIGATVCSAALVAAAGICLALPATATGGRDTDIEIAISQNGSSSGVTVGGQLTIDASVRDTSGSCTNFDDCDVPSGTVDVVLQNADLSFNQTIVTLTLHGNGPFIHDLASAEALITNPLPPGTYHIDGHYNGDDNFAPNDGTGTTSVAALTPTVDITQSSTSSYQGEAVTFSADVEPANGITATGTVQLIYGSTDIGTPLTLDGSGKASITRTDLPLSDASGHTYYFHYSGDTFLTAADSASIDHQVLAKTPTTTTVTATSPVRQDDSIFLNASVLVSGGTVAPGTLTYQALLGGVVPLYSQSLPVPGDGLVPTTWNPDTLPPGPYTITARYTPDSPAYATSSASTSLVVTPAIAEPGVVLSVTADPSPGALGAPETLKAVAVAPAGATTGFVFGTVDLTVDDPTPLGSCTLALVKGVDGTTCELSVGTLPAGHDTITADYTGSSHFAAVSASTALTVTEPSTTTLTATPTAGPDGTRVTLHAHVTAETAVAGEPGGTVAFRDGGGLVGSATVDASGDATLATTDLPVGSSTLTAAYSGDSILTGSVSGPVSVTISAAPTPTSEPTATPTPTPSRGSGAHPSAAEDPSSGAGRTAGGLAATGAPSLPPLTIGGALLLLAGTAMMFLARRRRQAHHRR